MKRYEAGPDGGWGWIVCMGTFIVAFIVEGTTAAFGVIIVPIQQEFSASKSITTWVASLSFGVCYIIGPIVSIFLERYTLRQVTIVGALVGFLAFTIAAFSPNIIVLIVAYGIFGGLSMGITFLTAIVAVGRYFNRRRAVATGIAMSGAGFGMFAYPFFTEMMLHVLDWRGTVLIMAAIYLHCAVSGVIFRPIPVLDTSDKDEKERIMEKTIKKPLELHITKTFEAGNLYQSLPQMNIQLVSKEEYKKSKSMECIHNGYSNIVLKNGLPKKDIYHSGFMQMSCEQIHFSSVNEELQTENEKIGCVDCAKYEENFKVLKNPKFILVLLVMMFWSAQYICTLYIPDFAISQGISGAESAVLVSFIGVTNTLGRILTGFIVDFLHISSITLYLIAFVVVTIGTFLLPLCSSFMAIAVYSVVSGFCVGTFAGMRTIFIVDIVGIDHLSHAFGWVSFFQGLSSIPFPPLAGFIYDVSGSYGNAFLLVASYYVCGTVTTCILRLIPRCKNKSKALIVEEPIVE